MIARVIASFIVLAVISCSYTVSAYGYGPRPASSGRHPNPSYGHNYPDYNFDNDYEWIHPSNADNNQVQSENHAVEPVEDFSYSKQGGPANWGNIYPKCGGSHQSPINLAHTHSKALAPLYFNLFWDNTNGAHISNTGKVVEIKLTGNGRLPTISGGPLTDVYQFVGLHFHWGDNDFDGSEHVIGGKQFTMEAHVVHYKKSYGSSEEAQKHADGLAVVAFLLQVSGKQTNKEFQQLVQHLSKIKKADTETPIAPSTAFHWFKERTHDNFFSYKGSLTTPPCSEVVTWIVFQKPISISSSQAAEFRTLRNADNEKIDNNHRFTQNYQHPDILFVHGHP